MTSACEVYVVRHGETDWNVQGRMQGHTDIPLNETGIAQAIRLGQLLADVSFAATFSSDLSRARQTADWILKPRSLPIIESSALRERSAGALEGLSTAEIDREVLPFFLSSHAQSKETYFKSSWHPELEATSAVFQRVMHFLSPYINLYQEQTILVISHAGVLRTFLDYVSFIPGQRWVIANCGFIKLRINQQTIDLLDQRDVIHRQVVNHR